MEMVSAIATTAALLLPFLAWLMRWAHEKRFIGRFVAGGSGSLPPGSMGWPLIGEMIDFLRYFKFRRRPEDFIAKRKARYGDTGIYRSHLFGSPVIITCSPEFNKQVLSSMTEEGSLSSGWPSNELMGSSSIAAVDGVLHKRLRKHLMEAFTNPKALDAQISIAQPIFISALENWVYKRRIVAYHEAKAMTFRNICEVLVSFKSEELLGTMESLYRGLMAGLRSLTINIPGTAYHHALKCRKQLTDILLAEMRKRKEQGVHKQDFMQILIDAVDENGAKLSEMEVVENIVSLILGGYESTSDVMTWGLYYLAKHPEILLKLKEEAKLIRNGKHKTGLLSIEDIKSMKYTSKEGKMISSGAHLIRQRRVTHSVISDFLKSSVILSMLGIHIYEGRDEMPYGGCPNPDFQCSIRLTRQDSMDPSCNPKKALLHNILYDHRPLKLNDDDYMHVCRVPKKKGANFRDFPGVRVGPNNIVEFDPEVERVLLPSGSPLVPDYAMSFIKGRSLKPFGRLRWDETMPTVVTRAEPHNQASRISGLL